VTACATALKTLAGDNAGTSCSAAWVYGLRLPGSATRTQPIGSTNKPWATRNRPCVWRRRIALAGWEARWAQDVVALSTFGRSRQAGKNGDRRRCGRQSFDNRNAKIAVVGPLLDRRRDGATVPRSSAQTSRKEKPNGIWRLGEGRVGPPALFVAAPSWAILGNSKSAPSPSADDELIGAPPALACGSW